MAPTSPPLIRKLLDELQDIWRTRNDRARIVLYQLDSFVLALLTLGNCAIGETISSALWRMEVNGKFMGKFRPVLDWLFRVTLNDVDHCKGAYQTYLRITGALR